MDAGHGTLSSFLAEPLDHKERGDSLRAVRYRRDRERRRVPRGVTKLDRRVRRDSFDESFAGDRGGAGGPPDNRVGELDHAAPGVKGDHELARLGDGRSGSA